MRALLPYLALYKRHQWMLIFGMVLVVTTILAGIGLLTLSGWFLSASAVAGITGFHGFNYMLPAVCVRSAAIIRIASRYFERLVSHDATLRVLQNLRVFTYNRLMPLSPGGLARFRQGELLNCVVADIDTLDHLYLGVISPLAGALVVIVVMTLCLSALNVRLALMLGGIMALTLFLFPTLFYCAGKVTGENITNLRGKYRQQLVTWLRSQTELTLFGAMQHYRVRMDNTELDWHKAQHKQAELISLSQTLMTLINGFAVITILWVTSIEISKSLQSSTLIALFVSCSLAAFEALAPVTNIFQHLGQIIASALRITQLTKQLPEVQFTKKHTKPPTHVALHFQNVTFTYEGRIHPALNNFTLDISAGEHVAILGPTGCGKSTLLQLLTRAWDPQQGLISINKIPLTDFSELALRRTVSVVTQRLHLFSATLRDNLLLATPDATDAHLSVTLEQVGLQNMLEDEGLSRWLGEGGRQLSGGEIRRLAIARALLHDNPLMLLDEPTEGLDAISENQILNLFKQVMQNKTVLMVTHHLYKLVNFDRIIVMKNGQIIKQSNYTELLTK